MTYLTRLLGEKSVVRGFYSGIILSWDRGNQVNHTIRQGVGTMQQGKYIKEIPIRLKLPSMPLRRAGWLFFMTGIR